MLVLSRLEGEAMVLQGPNGKRIRLEVKQIDLEDRSFELLVQSPEFCLVAPVIDEKPLRLQFDGWKALITPRFHRGRRNLRFEILVARTVQVLREELVENESGDLLTRKSGFARASA